MSYYPYIGDRVTDTTGVGEGTVLYVHGKQAVVVFDGEDDCGLFWFNEIAKVEPRPKVREQNVGLTPEGYVSDAAGSNARIAAQYYMLPSGATVKVAVVCDLDGHPLEVQT